MFRTKFAFLVLVVFIFKNTLLLGQMPLAKTATVSILTCQEGNELYSLFGHTAIRIKDDTNALDVVYNYGTFDFKTENFYLKFIKGDLQYFVSAYSFDEFYYEYTLENRSIYEQPLHLTDIQKQGLFDALNKSLQSDEKYYTYKFIDRNCTNMVVNKVNHTLGEVCIAKTTEKDQSYRQILFPYLETHFYENLGINILFGKKVDENGEKLFLPNQFMESLKVAKVDGKLISGLPTTILKAQPATAATSLWNNFYTFAMLLLLVLITRKAWVYLTYFALLGFLGLFLSWISFYSLHKELASNYNVLLFNPLLLVLIVLYWKKSWIWVKRTSQLSIVMVLALVIVLLNKPNLVMFLPMIITSLTMLFYFLRKSNKALLPAVK